MRHILNLCRAFRLGIVCAISMLISLNTKEHWLCRALVMMGPAFIKIGQFLSMRPDIVGAKVAKELEFMRDQLDSFPFKKTLKIFRNDFNTEKLFQHIDEKPVSAASIAQVYRAIDFDGSVLAVKVIRPNVGKQIIINIELMRWIVRIVAFFDSTIKNMQLDSVFDLMLSCTQRELDLRLEAAHATEFAENNKRGILIPRVYWDKTSKNVLVMEWIEGSALSKDNYREHLARNITMSFFDQACDYGLFHADMHTGNIIYVSDGNLALVDFGKVGRLDIEERYYIREVFCGFINKDYKRVAQAHFDLKYVEETSPWFVSACRSIGESVVGKTIDQVSAAKLFSYMFDVAHMFGMRIRPNLMLFHKNLLMLEGIFSEYASFNMWHFADIWFKESKNNRYYVRPYILAGRKIHTMNNILLNLEHLGQNKSSGFGKFIGYNYILLLILISLQIAVFAGFGK